MAKKTTKGGLGDLPANLLARTDATAADHAGTQHTVNVAKNAAPSRQRSGPGAAPKVKDAQSATTRNVGAATAPEAATKGQSATPVPAIATEYAAATGKRASTVNATAGDQSVPTFAAGPATTQSAGHITYYQFLALAAGAIRTP